MKLLSILFLILFSFLSFAQEIESKYLSSTRGSFGRDFTSRVRQTEQVLSLAMELAQRNGINLKRVSLQNREGKSYPALEISPIGSSPQNREAARVGKLMYEISLILSPFDLSSGANAFFDPNGSKIGVPYKFLLENGEENSSYLHELYHAGSFQKVLSGKSAPWAGLTKLIKGTFLSSKNKSYYFRFGSVDEIVATALSIKLDTLELLHLEKTLPAVDFYRSRGEGDQLINEIYHSALIGAALTRQTVDLVDRALRRVDKVENRSVILSLGKTSKTINESVFILDSYNWEIVGGSGAAVPVREGSYFSLYASKKPSTYELKERLLELRTLALTSERMFVEIEKSIYVLIEYPDLKKTDLRVLSSLSSGPFELLNR